MSPENSLHLCIFLILIFGISACSASHSRVEWSNDPSKKNDAQVFNELLKNNRVIFEESIVRLAENCKRIGDGEDVPGYDTCTSSKSRKIGDWRVNLRDSLRDTLDFRRKVGWPPWKDATHIVVVNEEIYDCQASFGNCGFKYNYKIVPYSCDL
jgi:hypothetical protein